MCFVLLISNITVYRSANIRLIYYYRDVDKSLISSGNCSDSFLQCQIYNIDDLE